MLAPINKIIEFSTVDGPGLRTSVFVQKCNIHCLYCHNPETQNICINCGKCVKTCKAKALTIINSKVVWDKDKCINCDTCIKTCDNHASPKVTYMSAKECFDVIKKNIPFIRGITVSGGECSLYPEFLEELFKLAKEYNLSCLMDSNGMIDYSKYPNLISLVDGVMLDIKSWNNDIYERLTGFSNDIVKKNLNYLAKLNKISELRIVYVADYVDAKNCLNGIKEIIGDMIKNVKIKLITFRKNGVRGVLANHESPSVLEMNQLKEYALGLGFNNIELR